MSAETGKRVSVPVKSLSINTDKVIGALSELVLRLMAGLGCHSRWAIKAPRAAAQCGRSSTIPCSSGFLVSQPGNTGSATLQGFEIAYQQTRRPGTQLARSATAIIDAETLAVLSQQPEPPAPFAPINGCQFRSNSKCGRRWRKAYGAATDRHPESNSQQTSVASCPETSRSLHMR